MVIVIDVSRFRELPQFKAELEGLVEFLKQSPVQEGKEVLYPGELEARREAEVRATGIPLAAKTVETIQEEMDHYGVAIRLAELGQPAPLSG
jgi:LDH2 family malate/lactate/ureidoglycolate dehydrogenase